MDENVVGKLLPNLKITLGNELDSDDQKEEGEISDTLDTPEKVIPEKESTNKNIDVVRTWMKTLQNPKVYENKDGGFITGLDLSSEVLIKKLEERAERFGLEKLEGGPITQKEIDTLYKSLGIEPENLNSCKLKNIRLDALHMRGVEEMSTKDIFGYFGDYGPASVEWINDFSCNVVWLDTATTARAMLGVSKAFVVRKKTSAKAQLPESLNDESTNTSEIEAVIEMSDSEESDTNEKPDEIDETSMDLDEVSDENKPPVDAQTEDGSPKVDSEALDVPVPPGYWRLGLPHNKAKAILLRFATKDDKKLPGAEKRSQYYQKYGNPNYGGLKGLISTSRKRKMQAARTRQVVEKFTDESTSQQDIAEIMNSGEASTRPAVRTSRIKMPRMRMYADDEEERKKMRHESEAKPKSVHSRLGTKYTKDDLFHLGSRFSSESEEEDDNVAINCTVPPSRYNIWTDIAKSMAKEDPYKPRSQSPPDFDPYEYRRSSNHQESRFVSSTRDSRSSRDLRSQRSSQDLRSTLSSSQRRGVISDRPHEDLRSKIRRLQKDDSSSKHRSPLCKDD